MDSELFVAWRSGGSNEGRWGPVGCLRYTDGIYRFVYTQGARSLPGFTPFSEMPSLDEVYESTELFPLFSNRLLARSRPEYEAYLKWGGLELDSGDPPNPIVILAVTEGRRATDSIELFPCPLPVAEGCYINKFFLHGVRWMSERALAVIDRLKPDDLLYLSLEPENKFDRNAVAVRARATFRRMNIGYVPRYLARDVSELYSKCGRGSIEVTVKQINRDAPLQQRVLCRMKACWPEGFQPCQRDEFQPIMCELPSQSC